MTKLQTLTLRRIKALLQKTDFPWVSISSYLPENAPRLEEARTRDQENSKRWSDGNSDVRSAIEMVEALLAEPEDEGD